MFVSSVSGMREMDKKAAATYGIPELLLMENAASGCYEMLKAEEPELQNAAVLILCGSGNNGGDGLALARLLNARTIKVSVFMLGNRKKSSDLNKQQYTIAKKCGVEIKDLPEIPKLHKQIKNHTVIVDAVLGTGISRPVTGYYHECLTLLKNTESGIYAIDVPSGINGDSGMAAECTPECRATITLGSPKIGNLVKDGRKYCGKLYVSSLSFPPEMFRKKKIFINIPSRKRKRSPEDHKTSRGQTLIFSGSSTYFGAPLFSASACSRSGCGYVKLVSEKSVISTIASEIPETVFLPVSTWKLSEKEKEAIQKALFKSSTILIGPGLGRSEIIADMLLFLIKNSNGANLILDGDALYYVPVLLNIIKTRKGRTLLTPHAGEMSIITKKKVGEILENGLKIVSDFSVKNNVSCLLKGPSSLLAFPDGEVHINLTGNESLATAGTGDLLSGIITALTAGNRLWKENVKTAAFLHGLNADLLSEKAGTTELFPRDLISNLPETFRYFEKNYEPLSRNSFNRIHLV